MCHATKMDLASGLHINIFDEIDAILGTVVGNCMYPYPLAEPLIATLPRVEGQVYMTQL